jgi:hypothetical protein
MKQKKSIGTAALLSILFGPIGLMYVSFPIGLILLLIFAIFPLSFLLIWALSIILSISIGEKINQSIDNGDEEYKFKIPKSFWNDGKNT